MFKKIFSFSFNIFFCHINQPSQAIAFLYTERSTDYKKKPIKKEQQKIHQGLRAEALRCSGRYILVYYQFNF